MKVLFLDIDGVLCLNDPHIIEVVNILCVKKIVDGANVKIVLSSAWRARPQWLQSARKQLRAQGVHIYDITPVIPTRLFERGYRWKEIQEWLLNHPNVDKFAILDDDVDAMIPGDTKSYFYVDYDTNGLTNEKADEIIKFFKEEL